MKKSNPAANQQKEEGLVFISYATKDQSFANQLYHFSLIDHTVMFFQRPIYNFFLLDRENRSKSQL